MLKKNISDSMEMKTVKNNHPMYGFNKMDTLSKIENPIERDMMARARKGPIYCMHCGQEVIPGQSERGHDQWERDNQSHYLCRTDYMAQERAKAPKPKPVPERPVEDISDDYMEAMMRQRGE